MVAAKNNKRKPGANQNQNAGGKRFKPGMNKRFQVPSFLPPPNQFGPPPQAFRPPMSSNPIPNPGFLDFSIEPMNQNRPKNMNQKNLQQRNNRPQQKKNFGGGGGGGANKPNNKGMGNRNGPSNQRGGPGPNFRGNQPMNMRQFPPPHMPGPFRGPFPGLFRGPPMPMPPQMGFRAQPMPMPPPPFAVRGNSGRVAKPGKNIANKKNKKPAAAPARKNANKHHGPTYPLDKPFVTDAIKAEHDKKVDIENRLKGNRNDSLFAQWKEQRDLFVKIYEAAKLEYIGKQDQNKKANEKTESGNSSADTKASNENSSSVENTTAVAAS